MTIQSIIKEHIENSISQKVIESAVLRALGNIDIEDVLTDALEGKIEDYLDDYVTDAIEEILEEYT